MLRLSLNISILAALLAGTLAAPPAADADRQAAGTSRARYLMGTRCEGVAYADHEDRAAAALEAAFDEIARLESILSDYRPDSELSRLNRGAFPAPFACSTDLFAFIRVSAGYTNRTGGAFDITIAPLVAAWDMRGAGRIAGGEEIRRALARVGSRRMTLDAERRTVRFDADGMALDPGGIGKGYALDAAARVLRSMGIESALLDFGGQMLAIGAPPGAGAWVVGVAHPLRRDEEALTVSLRDASISTSGNSERGIVVEGRDIGHIVDPSTGAPVATRRTVSVIAGTATEADALSTALLVMGPGEGLAWASEQPPGPAAIFLEVDAQGTLLVRATPGAHYNLTPGAATPAPARNEGGR